MFAHVFFISSIMLYLESGCEIGLVKVFRDPHDTLGVWFSRALVGLDFSGVAVWFSLLGGKISCKKAFLFSSKDCFGTGPFLLKL